MGGSSKGGGGGNVPQPPRFDRSYAQGAQVYLRYLPQFLQAEDAYRRSEDPSRVQAQQDLQNRYGPEQYREQLAALNQLDPSFTRNHGQLGDTVARDVGRGTALSPDSTNQLQQEVRGAQAARGNTYGDAAGITEAYTLGDRGQQLYQQRLQNAAGFLGSPTIPQQLAQVSPVSPDRTFNYADPSAGFQGVNAANARYQGQVGASAANNSGGGGSSWLTTVGQIAGAVATAY